MVNGGLSARLTGVYRMPQWCAESWGTFVPWQPLGTPPLEVEVDRYCSIVSRMEVNLWNEITMISLASSDIRLTKQQPQAVNRIPITQL